MKKFVSMGTINNVFEDITQIDYITVSSVTDSKLDLNIHLNSIKVPIKNSDQYKVYTDRCILLGKMLDRNVSFRFIPIKFHNMIINRFCGLFKKS